MSLRRKKETAHPNNRTERDSEEEKKARKRSRFFVEKKSLTSEGHRSRIDGLAEKQATFSEKKRVRKKKRLQRKQEKKQSPLTTEK